MNQPPQIVDMTDLPDLPLDDAMLHDYGITLDELRVWHTLLPKPVERRIAAYKSKQRFVHYTTAAAAVEIARSRSIWLRNTTCMNDFSEVHFGMKRVIEFFGGDAGKPFWSLLDELVPNSSMHVKSTYDGWASDLRYNTYVACVSEHDESEDKTGRLSMWRAYGPQTGVGIVINGAAFHSSSDALGAFSYPVEYAGAADCDRMFQELVDRAVASKSVFGALAPENLHGFVFEMLSYFSLALKHPGFSEEREWRVVHRPNFNPNHHLKPKVVVLSGLPQRVYPLPLKDFAGDGIRGVPLNELVDRVLVGPTQFPVAASEAIIHELSEAEVVDARKRVFVTDIPLRT
ncbi:MAG: DUF2971 domain-containing protein [Hyphomicrobiaceae bacterium]